MAFVYLILFVQLKIKNQTLRNNHTLKILSEPFSFYSSEVTERVMLAESFIKYGMNDHHNNVVLSFSVM